MNDYRATIRLHFVDRLTMSVLPWGILAIVFGVNYAIFAMIGAPDYSYTGGLMTLPCYLIALGTMMLTRSMPFGMMLGITRRRYYLGSIVTAAIVSLGSAIAVLLLGLLEKATDGWGIKMYFFRPFGALQGSWIQVLAVSFVGLLLCFIGGMWIGLIFRAWGMTGVWAVIGALGVVILAAAWIVTLWGGWHGIGDWLRAMTVPDGTVIAALVTVVLGALGYLTIRRATV